MTKVRIRQGELQGTTENGVHSFKGIPFAAPVGGLNRWRPPQPPETWEQVRDATRYGSVCHQPIIKAPAWLMGRAAATYMGFANMDEPSGDDCLNLNIWTPQADRSAKLPVMLWIHGGGSIQGAGSISIYDGTALARHDVVVVTINYRLGLAGFLSAPESFDGDVMAPNRGFLDQIAALEWVQENIESFGGDPDQVTIFGESAGGMSVSVLLGSPLTKGLFKRAIVMSGVPEAGASVSQHQSLAGDFFEQVKIKKGDISSLEALTGNQVVSWFDAADRLAKSSAERYGGLARGFGGASNAYDTEFMPVPILDAISAGQVNDVDLMLGTVKDEARLFSIMMPGPNRLGSALAMKALRNWKGGEHDVKQWKKAYRYFAPDAPIHLVREQIVADWMFRRGTVRAAEAHAASGNANTFLYQFEWETPALGGAFGSIHGVEIPLVFRNLEDSKRMIGDVDAAREFARQVSDLWLNFAKTGVPACDAAPDWEPFDLENRKSMTLNTKFEIRRDTDKEKSEFWGARREGKPF